MTESIYKEYENKYYNPNDNDKKPGDNDNWKSIQKGFHDISTTQLETSAGLTLGKGTEDETSVTAAELAQMKQGGSVSRFIPEIQMHTNAITPGAHAEYAVLTEKVTEIKEVLTELFNDGYRTFRFELVITSGYGDITKIFPGNFSILIDYFPAGVNYAKLDTLSDIDKISSASFGLYNAKSTDVTVNSVYGVIISTV